MSKVRDHFIYFSWSTESAEPPLDSSTAKNSVSMNLPAGTPLGFPGAQHTLGTAAMGWGGSTSLRSTLGTSAEPPFHGNKNL